MRVTKSESCSMFIQIYVFQIKLLSMIVWSLKGEVSLILFENSDYVEPFILSPQSAGASVLKISHQQRILNWAEICWGRGWTLLDKDYLQLFPVKDSAKGCCGVGDQKVVTPAVDDGTLTNIWGLGPGSDHTPGAASHQSLRTNKTLLKTFSPGVCSMSARCSIF